jgi:hypothetical protein
MKNQPFGGLRESKTPDAVNAILCQEYGLNQEDVRVLLGFLVTLVASAAVVPTSRTKSLAW